MHYMTYCLESKCRSFPTVRVGMVKKLLNLRWIKRKVKRRASRSLSWLWVKNAAIFCRYSWMWNTRTFILHGPHPVNKMLITQLRRDQRQDLKSSWEWLMSIVWMRKLVPLSLVNLVLFCSLLIIRLLARLEFGFADCPNCFFFNCNASHLIPRRRRNMDTEEFNFSSCVVTRTVRIHVTRTLGCFRV